MFNFPNFVLILPVVVLVAAFGLHVPASAPVTETMVSSTPGPVLLDTPLPTPTPTPAPALDGATQKKLQLFEDSVNASTPKLRDPTYDDLMYFLTVNDKSERAVYNDTYDCVNYAEAVKNNSEAAGMRGYYLGLSFWNRPDGHLINAWHTVDAGWVYVDCCGFDAPTIASGNWSFKAQVYPVAGEQYLKMAPKGVGYPVKGFGWGKIRDVLIFRDLDGPTVQTGTSDPY